MCSVHTKEENSAFNKSISSCEPAFHFRSLVPTLIRQPVEFPMDNTVSKGRPLLAGPTGIQMSTMSYRWCFKVLDSNKIIGM